MHCLLISPQENYVLALLLALVFLVTAYALWEWRARIPYVIEMLRTAALQIQRYPGPHRLGAYQPIRDGRSAALCFLAYWSGSLHLHTHAAFITLLLSIFWHYFTALGLLLSALLYDSLLMYGLLVFWSVSSYWVSAGSFTHHPLHKAMTNETASHSELSAGGQCWRVWRLVLLWPRGGNHQTAQRQP